MAKPIRLSKRDVEAIVRRRERGLPRSQIVEETGFGKNVVSVVLTARGLSRTDAATRRRYQKVLDTWLAKK